MKEHMTFLAIGIAILGKLGGGMSALGNNQGKINKYKEMIWYNFKANQ